MFYNMLYSSPGWGAMLPLRFTSIHFNAFDLQVDKV